MSSKVHRSSYCRVCHAYCGLEVEVEEGRVTGVCGDRSDPVYGGYMSIKGRQLPEMMEPPALRPRPDGDLEAGGELA